ncbi:MAG: hypothetical protein J6R35_00730, partial [Clostridia bacterium]|nr:hypothetical protein [Clostridia bacterium]
LSGKPNEKDYSSFLGDFEEESNDDWWIFDNSLSSNIDFDYDLTADDSYLALGIACANQDTGAPAPRVGLYNVRLEITYVGNINIRAPQNGSFEYAYYEDNNIATYSSLNINSPTVTGSGTSFSRQVTNPFAAIRIYPKETTTGYRVSNFDGATDYTYSFGTGNWGQALDANKYLYYDVSGLYTRDNSANVQNSGQAYLLAQNNTLNFTPRSIKLVYYSNSDKDGNINNDSTTATRYIAYGIDKTATASNLGFSVGSSLFAGWKLVKYLNGKGTTTTCEINYGGDLIFQGQQGATVDNNFIEYHLHALWVDVGVTGGDGTIGYTPINSYTEKYADATYMVTYTKPGYNLENVYATYTSGDLNGITITLECTNDAVANTSVRESGSYWTLYGVCGNFTLHATWVGVSFTPRWREGGSNGKWETYNEYITYYGIGRDARDMKVRYAWDGDGYAWTADGWKVTGRCIDAYGNETSYETFNYIPKNAISADCDAIDTPGTTSVSNANQLDSYTSTTTVTGGIINHTSELGSGNTVYTAYTGAGYDKQVNPEENGRPFKDWGSTS